MRDTMFQVIVGAAAGALLAGSVMPTQQSPVSTGGLQKNMRQMAERAPSCQATAPRVASS